MSHKSCLAIHYHSTGPGGLDVPLQGQNKQRNKRAGCSARYAPIQPLKKLLWKPESKFLPQGRAPKGVVDANNPVELTAHTIGFFPSRRLCMWAAAHREH